MSEESKAKLLQAYRFAVEAEQDVIADMIEDVILELMCERTHSTVTRGTQNTLEPPWIVTCGPDTVKLGTTVAGMSIDNPSKEVTS